MGKYLNDGHLREWGMEKFAALDMVMMWRGMFFTKTGGILFLNCGVSEVCFFYWAGFWQDTGGVSQLLGT